MEAAMKRKAVDKGVELFVVDSGDTHDGTALADNEGSLVDATYTQPLIKMVDYDMLCIGNHELYVSGVAQSVYEDFAPFWGDKYLASNTYYITADNQTVPIGKKYRAFTGTKGSKVLSMGFLYNFTGTSPNSHVVPVEIEIKNKWFSDALALETPDLIVLIGRMVLKNYVAGVGSKNYDWQVVVDAIRAVLPDTPIMIFSGHSHIRDYTTYGPNTYAIESGRYMETVGWMSLTKTGSIAHTYLDANVVTYNYHLGNELSFPLGQSSPLGQAINSNITNIEILTNASVVLGCAPQDYYLNRYPMTDSRSLYSVLTTQLAGAVQDPAKKNPVYAIINAGSPRYGRTAYGGKLIVFGAGHQTSLMFRAAMT
ncbi:hypothetical protein HK101_009121 [Irineochytrium annulatum]|nr:hypothetical protein HK101_009121 [Irineochytrium annulatum]